MEVNGFYKCEFCGNIVQLVNDWWGDLYCCGEIMFLIQTKLTDEGNEKHVPFVITQDNKLTVKIGEVEHPMLPAHYIQWIELRQWDTIQRKYFNHDDKPQADFEYFWWDYSVYSMCNIHWLWKLESK